MRRKLTSVADVVAWRLCLGCGACVEVCPAKALALVDVQDDGLRPRCDPGECSHCGDCLEVCPGAAIEGPPPAEDGIISLRRSWGNVLEMWEGYAADPQIRFLGSSGGIATALSLFSLEKAGLGGVLHIAARQDAPLTNVAVISRDRPELLLRTGSRYAPAATCSGLSLLQPGGPACLFVGKPCDVVALRKWQALQPRAGQAVALAVSIFCAGTPSTRGTRHVLEKLGVPPQQVAEFRYRGCGWPGRATAVTAAHPDADHSMSYEESWGQILSKHVQFRCRLCPDSTGELADISCGDPWYREVEPDDPGRSLVLVRTQAGRQFLRLAMQEGYVCLEPAEPHTLPRSQRSLLQRRQHLWGRLLALRALRVPIPRYRGFSLLTNWLFLPMREKGRSLAGTIARAVQRQWTRPGAPGRT